MAHLIKGIDLLSQHRRTELCSRLNKSSAGRQLTDVVPTDRVWTPKEERVVDREVTESVAGTCMDDQGHRRGFTVSGWFE